MPTSLLICFGKQPRRPFFLFFWENIKFQKMCDSFLEFYGRNVYNWQLFAIVLEMCITGSFLKQNKHPQNFFRPR